MLFRSVDKGVTIQQAREALDLARERKPKPAKIPAAYLDPIIAQVMGVGPTPQSKVNGHDKGEWWATLAGVEKMAIDEGIDVKTEDPDGMLRRCAIAAKIGLGPWVDSRNFTENRIYEMYKKERDDAEGERE